MMKYNMIKPPPPQNSQFILIYLKAVVYNHVQNQNTLFQLGLQICIFTITPDRDSTGLFYLMPLLFCALAYLWICLSKPGKSLFASLTVSGKNISGCLCPHAVTHKLVMNMQITGFSLPQIRMNWEWIIRCSTLLRSSCNLAGCSKPSMFV